MRFLGQGLAAGEEEGRLLDGLRAVDFFAPLSDSQLRKVLYFLKTVEFEAGETVFEKGEEGSSFYLIREGQARACVPGFFGDKIIGAMGPGEFFGELALILRQPRAASVRCVEPTVCYSLDRGDLELLMERSADVAEAIKSVARKRLA